MLTLKCHIEIKSKVTNKTVTFDYVNGIEVKTSCTKFTDTAMVTVSVFIYRLKQVSNPQKSTLMMISHRSSLKQK